MASQYDPRETAPDHTCPNAPDPHVLRTSQTLQAKAEIPPYVPKSKEPAPRLRKMQAVFTGLQARYG